MLPNPSSQRAVMADQIVITEKTSQAKDVRAAVGSHYGDILPAEGHLFDFKRNPIDSGDILILRGASSY